MEKTVSREEVRWNRGLSNETHGKIPKLYYLETIIPAFIPPRCKHKTTIFSASVCIDGYYNIKYESNNNSSKRSN